MRALFILLLIYFLTGILQISVDNTFTKKDIGFTSETDTAEIECIVLAGLDLSESLLENLEDQDNKENLCYRPKTVSVQFSLNKSYLNYRPDNLPIKNILVLHTSLPPPLI